MEESPTDWELLFSEVDEVKATLLTRGVTEVVNGDGILNKLEKLNKQCGRVSAVVDEIIAELNSDDHDVVVVDDGEDTSEVQLLYQSNKKCMHTTDSTRVQVNHKHPRGVKRPMTYTPSPASDDHKRTLTQTVENAIGSEVLPFILDNPAMDRVVTLPTENAALPEEVGTCSKQRDQINYLIGMFPRVLPEYLKIIVENCRGDEVQLNTFVTDALENKFYLPTVPYNNQTLNKVGDETLPGCSKSVCQPWQNEVKNPPVPPKTSTSPAIPLQADSATPSIQIEGGRVGGFSGSDGSALVAHEESPSVSGIVNLVCERTTSGQDESEDSGSEEKDDLEKSKLYSEQLEYLIGVLPDADPAFLEDKISELEGDAEKLKNFVALALECPGGRRIYQTRGEIQQKQEHEAQVMKFTKNFSVEDFLEVFPDPVAHFENPERLPDLRVRDHCIAYLKARYKALYVNTICQVFKKERFNLSLSVKELDKDRYPKRKTKRTSNECKLPPNQCVTFLQEVAYIENKQLFAEYFEAKKRRRLEKFEEAKAKNELLTCNCCFDDELLTEDMSSCADGHLFCVQCVKQGAEVAIGDGKTSFPCMQEDCKAQFSLATLQVILAPSIFGKLVMRLQAEEVNAAGIEGLETCPSCPYSTIPPPDDKVFKCLNPECMKETCRSCKEPSHIPLKCEEVEKNDEIQARTYIENKMTEALIRTCWKCNQKFIKESGCNKMTCTCGALMCYICRQPVKDYQHFNPYKDRPNDLCPLYSDDAELHIQSVKTEAEKAKEEVMRQNPNVNLKHDPTLKLPAKPSSSKGPKDRPLNPFIINDDENPGDFLLMGVHDYLHATIHNHLQNNVRHMNLLNGNGCACIPEMRNHNYAMPPPYEVPQVVHVVPMPRNQVPQPADRHRVRPYPIQNIPPHPIYPVVGNARMPVPPRPQPGRHHVYPPPPGKQVARNNSKH